MSLPHKIPVLRMQGIPEEKTYWALIADERDDVNKAFIQREIHTFDWDELDSAKLIAIEIRCRSSDFTRNVRLVQKSIDDQFC
jgi:hypothetical protein